LALQGWAATPVPAGLDTLEVRTLEVGRDGTLWMGVRDRALGRLDPDGTLTWTTQAQGLMSDGVADVMEDTQGRLWVAGFGGIAVRAGAGWEALSSFGGLTPRVVFSVYEEPEGGAIWLGAVGGAARLVDGRWSIYTEADGLPHRVVHAVVVDRDGVAWLACRTGLARVSGEEIEVLFPELNIRAALAGPDGTPWFGTSDGVYHWDGSAWRHFLEGKTVYPSLVASDGALWAGSAADGLFRFDGAAWHPVELPARQRGAEVFDVAEGPGGEIWVGTARGLVRLTP
jgi:ligand-binding sensor domain-containing protein